MSGKPDDNTAKNIAYTITTGYYPELASRIKFGGRLSGGKGAMGAKYAEKRGFSSSSLRRIPYEASDRDALGRFKKKGKPGTGVSQEYEYDEFFYHTKYKNTAKNRAEGRINPDGTGKPVKGGWRRGKAYVKDPRGAFGSTKERAANQGMLGKTEAGNPQSLRAMGYGKGTPQSWDDLSDAAQESKSNLQKISYTKWMGGTELHKLYGTKVWYEEGIRSDRKGLAEALKTWGNAIKEGETGALPDQFLSQVYSRSESKLVNMASEFAKDLFEGAYEMGELEKDLESVGGGKADVAEEDVAEARAKVKGKNKEFFRSTDLSIDKASKAQKLDILTKTEDGHDLYLDSTEVAMTEDTGHGIVDLGGSAMDAVKTAIKGLKKDGGDINQLKELVQKFFVNNIDREYNPAIKNMKQLVMDQKIITDKNATVSFKNILDAVDKNRKKLDVEIKEAYDVNKKELYQKYKGSWKSDLKVGDKNRGTANDSTRYMSYSVMNIAANMGKLMRKGSTKAGQEKTISTQTMKYVVHMLASLGDNQTRQFRQGHRLFTYPDNTKVYASVPMSLHEKGAKSLLFKTKGFRSPEGTLILHGESHLLALAVHNGAVKSAQTRQIAKRQAQAHATRLITGRSNITEKQMKFESDAKLKMDTIPATVVVFNPKKLEDVFQKIMGVFQKGRWTGADVGAGHAEGYNPEQHKFEKKAKDLMDTMVWGWPKKPMRKNKARGSLRAGAQDLEPTTMFNANKFWALPYIGINDNVYRGKGSQQS